MSSTGRRGRNSVEMERDKLIDGAVAAGKIHPIEREAYEVRWQVDMQATRDLVASLQPRARFGGKVAASASARTSAAPIQTGGLSQQESGEMVYAGRYPVAMEGGEPHVFTTSGWMKVAAFEASALSSDDLDTAAAIVSLSPSGYLAKAYRGD